MSGFQKTFKRASVNISLLQVVFMLINNNITLKYTQTDRQCVFAVFEVGLNSLTPLALKGQKEIKKK